MGTTSPEVAATASTADSVLGTQYSVLILVRRYLVLTALMFWQGGFTFYAAVVVPIGTAQLGGATEQGFITRHVAWYLNVAGAVALVILAWDAAATRAGW